MYAYMQYILGHMAHIWIDRSSIDVDIYIQCIAQLLSSGMVSHHHHLRYLWSKTAFDVEFVASGCSSLIFILQSMHHDVLHTPCHARTLVVKAPRYIEEIRGCIGLLLCGEGVEFQAPRS